MGHVYHQRYKNFPIEDKEHFFVVCRYLERNALRAGFVKRAEDWRWGSLWRWLQNRNPNPNYCHRGCCPGFPAGRLASTRASRKRNWMRFGCLLSEASHSATKPGWNRWQDGLTLNPPGVLETDHKSVFHGIRLTHRPDPIVFGTPLACLWIVTGAWLICESRSSDEWHRRGVIFQSAQQRTARHD